MLLVGRTRTRLSQAGTFPRFLGDPQMPPSHRWSGGLLRSLRMDEQQMFCPNQFCLRKRRASSFHLRGERTTCRGSLPCSRVSGQSSEGAPAPLLLLARPPTPPSPGHKGLPWPLTVSPRPGLPASLGHRGLKGRSVSRLANWDDTRRSGRLVCFQQPEKHSKEEQRARPTEGALGNRRLAPSY